MDVNVAESRASPQQTSDEASAAHTSLTARVALRLVAVIVVITTAFMVVSHRQRSTLLQTSLKQQIDLLGAVLQRSAHDLIRQDRVEDLDRLLRLVLQSDDVFAAFVWSDEAVLAGDAADLPCLSANMPPPTQAFQQVGAAECGTGVLWSAIPMREVGGTLVVSMETRAARSAIQAGLRRELMLTALLACAIAVAVWVLLRSSMAQPLAAIVGAVKVLASAGSMPPLRLATPTRELTHLAATLNNATRELDARREELFARAEEKLALERRLAQSEKFAMIGRLSGGLAHELGSPLSVIGIRAEVIEERCSSMPEVCSEARAIVREVDRVTAFIHGLLHLSRTHGMVFVPVDVARVARGVVADLGERARDVGVAMRVEITGAGDSTVPGQETMLRHALHNVVRNAIQALAGHEGERLVAVRVAASDDEVAVVVEDNGPGIPPLDLPRVFEPFHTTRPAGHGIGLGLPVTRGIIEEHGGQIAVENRAEGGARVTVLLPRKPSPRRGQDGAPRHD